MDLTQGSEKVKNVRAKKMMLWFGIISLIMSFGGFTSAYIVSSKRPDWNHDFEIPQIFFISTAIIILSSITFHLAKKSIAQGKHQLTTICLMLTLVLGIIFIFIQFAGFQDMVDAGYNFTGPTSTPTTSFIFIIAFVHILHVIAGLIALLVVIYNHYKQKYNASDYLGLELGATFWHFIDILWLYLILFFYFYR
jgi:cytochrome c oxidase subunit 3